MSVNHPQAEPAPPRAFAVCDAAVTPKAGGPDTLRIQRIQQAAPDRPPAGSLFEGDNHSAENADPLSSVSQARASPAASGACSKPFEGRSHSGWRGVMERAFGPRLGFVFRCLGALF